MEHLLSEKLMLSSSDSLLPDYFPSKRAKTDLEILQLLIIFDTNMYMQNNSGSGFIAQW